jgi:lysylphosphatidylglycerol synthetase-like protein (DUF2156 family)
MIEILGFEKAPDNFTKIVMDRIGRETVPTRDSYTPIINKWGWLIIFFVFILFIAGYWFYVAIYSPHTALVDDSLVKDWWSRSIHPFLNSILSHGNQFQLVILIGITAISLLFADRIIENKLKKRISYN